MVDGISNHSPAEAMFTDIDRVWVMVDGRVGVTLRVRFTVRTRLGDVKH
jgi:hypothetical protein